MTQETQAYLDFLRNAYVECRMTAAQVVSALTEYADAIFYSSTREDWAQIRFEQTTNWKNIYKLDLKKCAK